MTTARTEVYGVIGWPVGHSLSPQMHTAALRALGRDAVYVAFGVRPPHLASAIGGLGALGVRGVNITLPHKERVMQLVDALDDSALSVGAVNTLYRDGERWVGSNTDAAGLARSVREAGVAIEGSRVWVVGAGGAARAAVVGLAQAGASSVVVSARRSEQSTGLAQSLAGGLRGTALEATGFSEPELARAAERTDLMVQATSATLHDHALAEAFAAALPLASLPVHAVVMDLVYTPLETTVLRRARRQGLRTLDGLGMLIGQAALSLERWTGQEAPLAAMREALASGETSGDR